MGNGIVISAPFASRFMTYLRERFSLLQFVPLVLVITVTSGMCFKGWNDLSATAIVLSSSVLLLFLLRLRLFDEFKDATHDRAHYPNRPVPRGLVSLRELSVVVQAVVILEIAIAAVGAGRYGTLWFGVAFAYSLLMRVEFFRPRFLRSHFTLYVLSHELLLIPLLLYVFSWFGQAPVAPGSWLMIGLLGGQFFLFEVARKIKSPSEEIVPPDTYSGNYGVYGSVMICVVLGLLSVVSGSALAGGWDYRLLTVWLAYCLLLALAVRARSSGMTGRVLGSSIAFAVLVDAMILVRQ